MSHTVSDINVIMNSRTQERPRERKENVRKKMTSNIFEALKTPAVEKHSVVEINSNLTPATRGSELLSSLHTEGD